MTGGHGGAEPRPAPAALVELRVLGGANLYFPRPAVKLTLDVGGLLDAPTDRAMSFADALRLKGSRPGEPGTGQRQRFAARAVARLVRLVAAAAGTSRLAVRSRPTADGRGLVVAYPWRRRGKAEALGEAVARVLDLAAADVRAAIDDAGAAVRDAPDGPRSSVIRPRVPVVAVTGTNGKTTTSRLIAHIARAAGLVAGWSSTDGIYVDGELVEEGDYSGPSGAGRVLADARVQFAVTETARGGVLLRGIGVAWNDVAVVTNVTADHLGLQGVDTLDQLAEVKAVVTKITKPEGWVVVNGDDPRTFAMRLGTKARAVVFSRDPDSPSLRAALDEGGRAITVLDGDIVVLRPGEDPEPIVAVVDVPLTLSGLSHFNVENALAATGAGLAAGLSKAAVVEGLRTFLPDTSHNPGRMNIYTCEGITVILDLAHNEAGVAALVEVMRGLVAPGGAVRLGLGTAGDRTDEILVALGEIGARGADELALVHKMKYLRGRTADEIMALFREGAANVGVTDVGDYDDEMLALRGLMAASRAGDVVGLTAHEQRVEMDAWLHEHGGTADDPATIRAKVLAARGGEPG